jgi:hypothetical protein
VRMPVVPAMPARTRSPCHWHAISHVKGGAERPPTGTQVRSSGAITACFVQIPKLTVRQYSLTGRGALAGWCRLVEANPVGGRVDELHLFDTPGT